VRINLFEVFASVRKGWGAFAESSTHVISYSKVEL
jgi:hypothetical protein